MFAKGDFAASGENKKAKASVLAMSLIIMGIVVMAALAFSLTTLEQRKASIGSSRSDQAYQNAESGVEAAMEAIVGDSLAHVSDLAAHLDGGSASDINGACVIKTSDHYSIQLLNQSNQYLGCSASISGATEVKSTGTDTADQDTRAIEAAVAFGHIAARGYRGASLALNSGWQKIPIDTISFDPAGIIDTSTGRITPTQPGYYEVNGQFAIQNATSCTGANILASLKKDGNEVARGSRVPYGPGAWVDVNVSDVMYFNGTTDYVSLWAYSQCSESLEASGSNSAELNYLSLVGPL